MGAYGSVLAAVIGVHVVALITPGPNVLLVSQTAISQSRRAGILTGLGVSTGAATWAALAVMGVGVLMNEFAWLYNGMKTVGGLYLIYLGWHTWQHANRPIQPNTPDTALPHNDWQSYRRGLFTALTNPKAMLFFGGVLMAVLAPNLPRWVYVSTVGIIGLDAMLYYTLLALALSTRPAQAAYLRAQRWLDRIAGGLMLFFGVRLALFH